MKGYVGLLMGILGIISLPLFYVSATNDNQQSGGCGSNSNQESCSCAECAIINADSEAEKCGECYPGIRSCLGQSGDGTGAKLNIVSSVLYSDDRYQIGINRGDYCMRNEELKQGCDYIGKDDPSPDHPFTADDFCCGVKLNTDVPFVGRCIATKAATGSDQSDRTSAFPRLMRALSNIVLTLILVGSMIMLVASGVMRAGGNAAQGKKIMMRVILSLVLLGASGIILRLINPVFFG